MTTRAVFGGDPIFARHHARWVRRVSVALLSVVALVGSPAEAQHRTSATSVSTRRLPAKHAAGGAATDPENSAILVMTLGPTAPFAKIIVGMSPDLSECGKLGCAIGFTGITRAGTRKDISQTDIIPNGFLGRKAEVFGAIGKDGMPRIVLEQGNIDAPNSRNLFLYDKGMKRYKFIEAVPDTMEWKHLLGSTSAPSSSGNEAVPPPTSSSRASGGSILSASYRDGTFRFVQSSKALCKPFYDGAPGAAIAAARTGRSWIELAQGVMGANCGADIAYYLLGEAAEQLGYPAAALSYYGEASRIASTASLRLSEHCVMNKGGSGFQKAGAGCFGVPIETASREAALRMQSAGAVQTVQPATFAGGGQGLGAIEYEGAVPAGLTTAQQQLQLQIGARQIVGRIKTQMGVLAGNIAVTGTYVDGKCTIQLRGGDDMVGTCDHDVFTGYFVNRKTGRQGNRFWFATASRWAQGRPDALFGSPNAPIAPAGVAVWALGRVRILVLRGARCGPEESLGKPYCFGQAINWLERHPGKREIDVIAMDNRYFPGSLVPYNGGQGWDVYRVSRRDGGYAADKQRHFATRINLPQGCLYDGVAENAWYVTIAGGHPAVVEAARYLCANWRGRSIYTRGLDYGYADDAPLDWSGTVEEYRATR